MKEKKSYMGKKDGWYYHIPTLPQSSPHNQICWNLRLWDLEWHPLPSSLYLHHSYAFLHGDPCRVLTLYLMLQLCSHILSKDEAA